MSPMIPPLSTVRVPASTSNLGPGFDCLGLCVSMFLSVRAVRLEPHEATRVRRSGEALDVEPGADLLVRAFERGRALASAAPLAVELEVDSAIPVGRGFGSSGAAVAAGLVLGVRSAGVEAESLAAELVLAGTELEGHPDNVTAALFGGCTVGVPLEEPSRRVAVLEVEVHPSLAIAAAWPATPLPTAAARRALPPTVAFGDAVENPRRLALLLEGLRTGDAELLRAGSVDRLHERYRAPLIPGAAAALASALEAGAHSANLSGAGSGVVALTAPGRAATLAAGMAAALGPGAVGRALEVVSAGALSRGPRARR